MNGLGGGREEVERREVLAREPAEALAGMLDIRAPTGGLPWLWHWIYLLDRPPQRELGPDGHPVSGVPAPPGPGRRRMLAGGRVRSHRLLRLGREATRTAWVAGTLEKTGRTGPLTFVTVRSEIMQDGELAIEDEQDIVYRLPVSTVAPAPEGEPFSSQSREPFISLEVDSKLLFRFSALTYNAHRIHYDHEYVRQEGYDDLVVHGPLQALMMGELLRRSGVDILGRQYAYRLVAPMIGPQRMTVVPAEQGIAFGAETRDARGVVTAVSNVR